MFSALSHFVFGASSLFGTHNQPDGSKTCTWKDTKLCFDLRSHDLELDRGEQLIGCFYPIEDVKGNQDELGLMKVTNLRLIWICCKKKRVNLSIGWRTVTLAYEQNLKDGLCGASASLFVLSKCESTKYEFVFTRQSSQADIWSVASAAAGSPDGALQDGWNPLAQLRKFSKDKAALISHLSPMYLDDPFEVVFKVWQAYKQTHLFRHCRSNLTNLVALNGGSNNNNSNIHSGHDTTNNPDANLNSNKHHQLAGSGLKLSDINKLPSEEIIEMFPGVGQNESRVVKYNGTLLLTNIRLIWIDGSVSVRNFSIPYIRVESIKLKQGDRILVNTYDCMASSAHVELQIQRGANNKTAKLVFEQTQNLCSLYKSRPRYGPESCEDSINFMSHMRPVEQFFDSVDRSMLKALENLGPEANLGTTTAGRAADLVFAAGGGKGAVAKLADSSKPPMHANDADAADEVERAEKDLDGYTTKLVNYLNEHPLHLDNELIYSRDLGLAIEKPANGASINSIWRIEV